MGATWTFHSAGQIVFGPGAVEQLGGIATRMGLRSVQLVSDPVLDSAGIVEKVKKPLREAGIEVLLDLGGEPEPTWQAAMACLAKAREWRPDGIIGLGGGSNMDLAKLTAKCLTHGGEPGDYTGDDRLPGPIMPLVCIPTTAGTGSEVSCADVYTDPRQGIKLGSLSNHLRPRLALVDPLLTHSCPPKVTADSGIDALVHAIEAFTAVDNEGFPLPAGQRSCYQGRHPMGMAMAREAISLAGKHLRRAVAKGTDAEARSGMALAAMYGGLAFSNVGVALVHALEYAVASFVPVSHGAGNGLLLPHVMRFNLPGRERDMVEIARLLGHGELEPARAIDSVASLAAEIGIPQRLRDLGARQDMLAPMAEKTLAMTRILRVNPRQPTVGDLMGILQSAY
ncbi:MAG: iron-containing alcohol dehydrogenase [Planctomycetes bacterium]|nr:iron-containing alcohol dehydrogenase [Planctomycetota bacterium]